MHEPAQRRCLIHFKEHLIAVHSDHSEVDVANPLRRLIEMDYPLKEYSMGDQLHRVLLLERAGCAVKHAVCINRQLLLRVLRQREHACCCDIRSEQADVLQVGAALRQCTRRSVCEASSKFQLDDFFDVALNGRESRWGDDPKAFQRLIALTVFTQILDGH